MVNTQMTSLWGGQKPPAQSFGGHIWAKGLFRTMPDFTEIKIYHHTGYSSVWGKVQVVSSMHLCISTARIRNTWASVVEKKIQKLVLLFVHRGMSYLKLFIFQLYPKYDRHCVSRKERLWDTKAMISMSKNHKWKKTASTTKAVKVLTNHLPLIAFLLTLEL